MAAAAILTQDLFFPAKLQGAARAAGVELVTCGTAERLTEAVADLEIAQILVDLTCAAAKGDLESVLQAVRSQGFTGEVVAYGPHVQTELLDRATLAGCDHVMTRGQLHNQLGQLFR